MSKTAKALTLTLIVAIAVSPLAALAFDGAAQQEPEKPKNTWDQSQEKGWFWGERQKWEEAQKREAEAQAAAAAAAQAEKDKPKEINCKNPDEWNVTCGFVSPERNYDFSQKQYKELTKQLAMYPDDAGKVMQYQKFVSWAVDQAMTAARTARWNLIQNQELNPFITNPVSSFGIRAATQEIAFKEQALFQDIVDQGGILVLFSRNDCIYCHKGLDLIRYVSNETKIPLYNASLDDQCLEGFEGDACYTGPTIVKAAQNLKVIIVPDLWIYLPKENGWIRVSSGLETPDIIKSRISMFFGAAKKAAKNGLIRAANSPQPSVDFTEDTLDESAENGVGVSRGVHIEGVKK